MGYVAVVLLPSLAIFSGGILASPEVYPPTVVGAAVLALMTDVLGLVISIWKVVFNPGTVSELEPITQSVLLTQEKETP
jgi:hypothetical protein